MKPINILIHKDHTVTLDGKPFDHTKYPKVPNSVKFYAVNNDEFHAINVDEFYKQYGCKKLVIRSPNGSYAIWHGYGCITRYYAESQTVSYMNDLYWENIPMLVDNIKLPVAIHRMHNKYRRRHARRKAMLKAA